MEHETIDSELGLSHYILGDNGVNIVGIWIYLLYNLQHVLAANVGKSIEHCLVLWMTNTGEMRNHQALACHTDTNKSHPMEIYSLFHRTGRKKMNGLLYLPLNNACIRVVCDEQIVVCNLSHTPHVPDQSRNTNNISKVHGPKP